MQPPTRRPVTSTGPCAGSSSDQSPVPSSSRVVRVGSATQSSKRRVRCRPIPRWVTGAGRRRQVGPVPQPVGRVVRRVHQVRPVQRRPAEPQRERQHPGGGVAVAHDPGGLRRGQAVPVELVEQVDRGVAAPRRHHRPDRRVDEHRRELGRTLLLRRARHAARRPCTPRRRRRTPGRAATARRARSAATGACGTPLDGDVTPIRSPGRSGAGRTTGMGHPRCPQAPGSTRLAGREVWVGCHGDHADDPRGLRQGHRRRALRVRPAGQGPRAIDQRVRGFLGHGWTGVAAESFVDAWDDWVAAAVDVEEGLVAMNELLVAARNDFVAQDEASQQALDADLRAHHRPAGLRAGNAWVGRLGRRSTTTRSTPTTSTT